MVGSHGSDPRRGKMGLVYRIAQTLTYKKKYKRVGFDGKEAMTG